MKVCPGIRRLVTRNFNDKDVDNLIEHFRDKERRKELFSEYKEIEMLYEIISPDAFLRPVWLLCMAVLVAYTLGLWSRTTAVLAWIIAALYMRAANRFDKMAKRLITHLEDSKKPGGEQ